MKVWVLVAQSKYGETCEVFSSRESAIKSLAEFAFGENAKITPTSAIEKMIYNYFEDNEDESYLLEEVEVQD